jgi:hypothetical protein
MSEMTKFEELKTRVLAIEKALEIDPQPQPGTEA